MWHSWIVGWLVAAVTISTATSDHAGEPRSLPACRTLTPGAAFIVLFALPDRGLERVMPRSTTCMHRHGASPVFSVRRTSAELARRAGVRTQDVTVVLGVFAVGMPETLVCRTLDGSNGFQARVARSQERRLTRVAIDVLRDGEPRDLGAADLVAADRLWVRLPIGRSDYLLVVQSPALNAPPRPLPRGLSAVRRRFVHDLERWAPGFDVPALGCGGKTLGRRPSTR